MTFTRFPIKTALSQFMTTEFTIGHLICICIIGNIIDIKTLFHSSGLIILNCIFCNKRTFKVFPIWRKNWKKKNFNLIQLVVSEYWRQASRLEIYFHSKRNSFSVATFEWYDSNKERQKLC